MAIRRVYVNKFDIIILDSDFYGKRKRLSTTKKADKRLLRWYEANFEKEYIKLYESKFGSQTKAMMTFAEYGEHVVKITSSDRNAFSQKEAERQFRVLCKFFGDMPMDAIKVSTVREWQNSLPFKKKTVLNYRSTLSQILKMAWGDDLINKNPVAFVDPPKRAYLNEVIYYSIEEVIKLIHSSKGMFQNYIQLCAFTGLRGSEMIALQWDRDIDFINNTLTVNSRIRAGDEDVPKNKTTRTIPLFRQAKEALYRQMKNSKLRGKYVFLNQYGKTYRTPDTLTVKFKKLCEEVGIPVGTIHDLRRFFNMLLKDQGYPKDFILDIMGHMDEEVNRRHYTGRIQVDLSKIENIAI